MRVGKLHVTWRATEREIVNRVEAAARYRITTSLRDRMHPFTKELDLRVSAMVAEALNHLASETANEVHSAVAGRLMTDLRGRDSGLRELLAMVLRGEVRNFLEQRAEDRRAAIEAANPCVEGYTEHDFGPADSDTCQRAGCGYTLQLPKRLALQPAEWAEPLAQQRSPADQVASAEAAAAAIRTVTGGMANGLKAGLGVPEDETGVK